MEDWIWRTARAKPLVWFNGQESSPSNALWRAISETGTTLLAMNCLIFGRIDFVVPQDLDGQRRESKDDDLAKLSLS